MSRELLAGFAFSLILATAALLTLIEGVFWISAPFAFASFTVFAWILFSKSSPGAHLGRKTADENNYGILTP
jgi:hypothetical protein